MKLFIISLDLLLALPIVSVGFMLLFSSIASSQSYLTTLAVSQDRMLSLVSISQQIEERIDSREANMTLAYQIAASASNKTGLTAEITDLHNERGCISPLALCRVITVSRYAKLLVVKYASSS
ncbi:MAG: hypothetical protein ABSD68_02685 [Candidatus Micrarchaeales archaeon]|jgi:hypothetical protein